MNPVSSAMNTPPAGPVDVRVRGAQQPLHPVRRHRPGVLGHSVRSAQVAVSALRWIGFPGPPPGRTVGPDPAWVDLARHPGAEQAPGVEVVRVEAGLFFANADYVRARIRKSAESADPRAVVLDAETSPSIDVTAAQMLADLANNLRSRGTRLLVARDVGQVRDVLRRVEVPEIVVGVYPTVDAAVEAALGSLGEIEAADPHARPMGDSGIPHAPAAPDTDGDDTVADGRDAE